MPNLKYGYYIFNKCTSLKTANLSGMNMPSVIDFSYNFNGCTALETADLSNINAPVATDISRMFYGCTALKSASMANFNSTEILDMRSMFYNDEALLEADLSNIYTGKCTNFNYLFRGCKAIKKVDLSSFDFSSWSTTLTDRNNQAGYLVYYCENLEKLDMSAPGWDFTAAGLHYFLNKCYKIKEWKVGKDCTFATTTYHNYAWTDVATQVTTDDPFKIICTAVAAQNLLRAANAGVLRTRLKDGLLKFVSLNDETTFLKIFYDGVETNDLSAATNATNRAKITVVDPTL